MSGTDLHKIKVALELSFAENGGSIILAVLELHAVKTRYVEPSCVNWPCFRTF